MHFVKDYQFWSLTVGGLFSSPLPEEDLVQDAGEFVILTLALTQPQPLSQSHRSWSFGGQGDLPERPQTSNEVVTDIS
jgi:hypothetical protein